MNRWVYVIAVIVVVVVAGGVSLAISSGVPVQAARLARGTIREFVDERGKTRLPETHLVTMPFAGRVESIGLLEGDRVERNQIVARIAPQDLADAVAEDKAAVDQLDAAIAENDDVTVETSAKRQSELFVESIVSTVAAAEARKTAGQSRLEYAETFLGRVRQLFETGAQTEDDLDRAKLSYIESEVDYRQDVLVAQSLKSMKAATDLMPRIISQYTSRKSLSRTVLEMQRQEAEARLRQALVRQERGVMRSPVDGVVLERAVSNEGYAQGGAVLLRIGELQRLEVEAEVLSEDVVDIHQGDPVEIYGPAIGAVAGQGVSGVVDRIYPAGFTKVSSLGVEQQRVLVIVRFAEVELAQLRQQRDLGVDFRVRVRIFTDNKSDASTVPRAALFRGADGGWQVFVVRNGRAQLQPVEVGLMNDEIAEVKTGLEPEDVVVLAPESSLVHEARVQTILRGE